MKNGREWSRITPLLPSLPGPPPSSCEVKERRRQVVMTTSSGSTMYLSICVLLLFYISNLYLLLLLTSPFEEHHIHKTKSYHFITISCHFPLSPLLSPLTLSAHAKAIICHLSSNYIDCNQDIQFLWFRVEYERYCTSAMPSSPSSLLPLFLSSSPFCTTPSFSLLLLTSSYLLLLMFFFNREGNGRV